MQYFSVLKLKNTNESRELIPSIEKRNLILPSQEKFLSIVVFKKYFKYIKKYHARRPRSDRIYTGAKSHRK